MKCKECGGLIIKAPAHSTAERTYEYVCNRCGLVYEVNELIEAELIEHESKETSCKICGRKINYKGKGRKPKYCKVCVKHVNRIQTAERMRRLRKNKLSKNDVFLLAIQKRAS